MADIWLDSVEERLDKLEALVYDNEEKDAAYPKVNICDLTGHLNVAMCPKICDLWAFKEFDSCQN